MRSKEKYPLDSGRRPWTRRCDSSSRRGSTAWAVFPADASYLGAGKQSFTIDYRVDDLDSLRATLRANGVDVDDRVDEFEYGRCSWCTDLEGNRIELWEPGPGN